MFRKKSLPEESELVVGTILKVNPYSALVKLEEYDANGMVHISEVSSKWIRDIREFVKEDQRVVCKVMAVERETGHIALSIKRVRKEDAIRKMGEYKNNERAEKILEKMLENKSLEEIYNELGYKLEEKFGTLYNAFKIAVKDESLLIRKGIDKKYADQMKSAAEKIFEKKQTEIKCQLELRSNAPGGIEIIRSALLKAKKEGVSINYISAPLYMMRLSGQDPKNLEKKVSKLAEQIAKDVESHGGSGTYKFV